MSPNREVYSNILYSPSNAIDPVLGRGVLVDFGRIIYGGRCALFGRGIVIGFDNGVRYFTQLILGHAGRFDETEL